MNELFSKTQKGINYHNTQFFGVVDSRLINCMPSFFSLFNVDLFCHFYKFLQSALFAIAIIVFFTSKLFFHLHFIHKIGSHAKKWIKLFSQTLNMFSYFSFFVQSFYSFILTFRFPSTVFFFFLSSLPFRFTSDT